MDVPAQKITLDTFQECKAMQDPDVSAIARDSSRLTTIDQMNRRSGNDDTWQKPLPRLND